MNTTRQDNGQPGNSKGHDPALRSEEEQATNKPMAGSPATAGMGSRDEEELDLGFDDGDLDTDDKIEY